MRGCGLRNTLDNAFIQADMVASVVLTTTAQLFDFPASAKLVLIAPSVNQGAFVNLSGGGAAVPAASASGSSAQSEYLSGDGNSAWRQIAGNSTGYSVIAATAGGYVTLSFYAK